MFSKTLFFSFTEGKGYISISNNLVKRLNIEDGMRIKWLYDTKGADPRLWAFHLTNNNLDGVEVKRIRSGNGLGYRINSVRLVNMWSNAFNIKKGETVRLYPNLKIEIEKQKNGEAIAIYHLVNIPFMPKRGLIDPPDQEFEQWANERENLIRKLHSLFDDPNNLNFSEPPNNSFKP